MGRVVSLLPSATDTVVALGQASLLVGRSHECDDPSVQHVPVVTSSKVGDNLSSRDTDSAMTSGAAALSEAAHWGRPPAHLLLRQGLGVYAADVAALARLRPDVILTQLQDCGGGEGQRRQRYAEALTQVLGYAPRVVHLEARRLADVWRDMAAVAEALGVAPRGAALVRGLRQRMRFAADAAQGRRGQRVVCVQWTDPWYAAGAWVPELIRMAGGEDVAGRVDGAVELRPQSVAGLRPDVLLFCICGLGLRESQRAAADALKAVAPQAATGSAPPAPRVAVFDGVRVFSRPGPLLAESLEALVEALHGEAQGFGHAGRLWAPLRVASSGLAAQVGERPLALAGTEGV